MRRVWFMHGGRSGFHALTHDDLEGVHRVWLMEDASAARARGRRTLSACGEETAAGAEEKKCPPPASTNPSAVGHSIFVAASALVLLSASAVPAEAGRLSGSACMVSSV
jgi:hypothetical protein